MLFSLEAFPWLHRAGQENADDYEKTRDYIFKKMKIENAGATGAPFLATLKS